MESRNNDKMIKAMKKQRSLHKQKGALKLYRLLEKKLFGDIIQAKKFRKWQNSLLQEKISQFKRSVRKTIRKYLTKKLELLGFPSLKFKSQFFEQLKGKALKVQIPDNFKQTLGILQVLNVLFKNDLYTSNLFRIRQHSLPKISLCFAYWKSATFRPSPFFRRHLVLLHEVAAIVINKNYRLMFKAWNCVSNAKSNPKVLPLLKSVGNLVYKLQKFWFSRVSQPRFPIRRRWEDPSLEKRYKRRGMVTAGYLLEGIFVRKQNVVQGELLRLLGASFKKWKIKATRSIIVPNFVRNRHSKKWSISILTAFVQNQLRKLKDSGFYRIKYSERVELAFPIDRNIIVNQANVLVKLESQLRNKSDALTQAKRKLKTNNVRLLFLSKLRTWVSRWRHAPKDINKEELFTYLNYLENKVADSQEPQKRRKSSMEEEKLSGSEDTPTYRSL